METAGVPAAVEPAEEPVEVAVGAEETLNENDVMQATCP